ncbi:MAG: PRC-barrel domain-containing protein [Rubrobacter sp.]|nr:PRC-barrel domain-containing protein [Rubrobacter sp.]
MSETGERGGFRQRIVDDYAGRKLYDERGEKVGKVEYTVLDTEGKPEYLAVKTGWFGSNTTLIPEGIVRPGERDDEFAVQISEDRIKEAPTFDNEDDVNSDFENRVREHFGLGGAAAGAASGESRGRGSDSGYSDSESRDRDDSRSDSRSDRDDLGGDDLGGDGRRTESRSRDDLDDRDRSDRGDSDRGDDRDRGSRDDSRSSESRSDSRGAATAGGAAGAASGIARDTDRDDDRRGGDRDDARRGGDRGSSGGEREKVKVTVKREKAWAERIRGEDGKEEVRIRKEMVEEEEMVEVEDRL